MHPHVIVLLRVIHIVAGAFLVGVVLFNAMFLLPSMSAAGPAAGSVMQELMKRKFPVYMSAFAGLLFLSGLILMWVMSNGFSGSWVGSRMGMSLITGAVAAFFAVGIGQAVNAKAGKRIGQIMASAGGKPSPEQLAEVAQLQDRILTGARAAATLMVIAAAAMAAARYL